MDGVRVMVFNATFINIPVTCDRSLVFSGYFGFLNQ